MRVLVHRPAWHLYLLVAALSLLGSATVGTLIPRHIPRVHDEFSYLLAGQTFANFSLTHPTPTLWRFFESHHVLMEPTMMSKYPPAPGLALAAGFRLGDPIYGVWLECAIFTAALTWMLRGFLPARWALLGGALAVVQFSLVHYWAQTFWGGAIAAAGGALVFGGAQRIWREPRTSAALLLGLGIALLMHSRPFEGLLACMVPAGLVFTRWLGRDGVAHRGTLRHFVLPTGIVVAAAALFLVYYNFRVTGSPSRLPYLEYESRYLGTPAFVWQKPPAQPPAFDNPAFADFYHDFVEKIPEGQSSPLSRLNVRLRILAYGYGGPVLGTLFLLGLCWRPDRRCALAFGAMVVVGLPLVVSYLFMPHYQAPSAAPAALIALCGLRRLFLSLPRRLRQFHLIALVVIVATTLGLASDPTQQHRVDHMKLSTRRQEIADAFVAKGGRHLIFVRLVKPYHLHDTWVFNYAPIAAQPVIWAWDRGPAENVLLLRAYPNRAAVLMTVHDGEITFTEDPGADTLRAPR